MTVPKPYNRTWVFIAACLALFCFGMTLITLGSILPELKIKFAIQGLDAGIIASILPIGILIGALIFGPIVDRYGYKLLLIFSLILSLIAIEGIAYTKSVYYLYFFIFLAGFGGGSINGGTSALVSDISAENKGASISLLGVFFGVGALGLPLILGLLSSRFEFEEILSVIGILMIIPCLFFGLIVFPFPKQAQGFPLAQGIRLIRAPALLLTGFFLFFQSGAEALINNWTTSYLHDKLNISSKDALFALSFSIVGLTMGRLFIGFFLKKVSSFLWILISLLLVVGAGFLLVMTAHYYWAMVALFVCGLGLAAGFPIMLGYIGQLFADLSGTAFSIAFAIALTGNTIINYIFGLITENNSIQFLPWMLIICLCFMLVILFLIKRQIGKQVHS